MIFFDWILSICVLHVLYCDPIGRLRTKKYIISHYIIQKTQNMLLCDKLAECAKEYIICYWHILPPSTNIKVEFANLIINVNKIKSLCFGILLNIFDLYCTSAHSDIWTTCKIKWNLILRILIIRKITSSGIRGVCGESIILNDFIHFANTS